MLSLLVWIALVGLVAWLIIKFIPMPDPFPRVVVGVAIVIVVLIVLQAFGILPMIDRPVPQIR